MLGCWRRRDVLDRRSTRLVASTTLTRGLTCSQALALSGASFHLWAAAGHMLNPIKDRLRIHGQNNPQISPTGPVLIMVWEVLMCGGVDVTLPISRTSGKGEMRWDMGHSRGLCRSRLHE